jgi:hypothetical protein
MGVEELHLIDTSEDVSSYDEGPYFLSDGQLFAAYLLYPDTNDAFIVSTIPSTSPFK